MPLENQATRVKNQSKVTENLKYFNTWARKYDSIFLLSKWLRSIQKKIVEKIPLEKELKILDVGCGTGYSLFLLCQRLPKSILAGIDISPEMVNIAQKKLKGENGIILKVGNVEKIPFKDNFFNYVISTEAFHHFPNPQQAMNEMTRVLKKDGMLIITDIQLQPLFFWNLLFTIEPGFIELYSKKKWRIMFEAVGVKVFKQERVGGFALTTVGKKN